MKTFKIVTLQEVDGELVEVEAYIKTEANSDKVQQAIQFVKMGQDPTIDKLLQALRTLGSKATQIKLESEATFEL